MGRARAVAISDPGPSSLTSWLTSSVRCMVAAMWGVSGYAISTGVLTTQLKM